VLAIGDAVPAFDLMSSEGATVNTGALGRQRVVLYLYSKDETRATLPQRSPNRPDA
jgi:peroxiredoxin